MQNVCSGSTEKEINWGNLGRFHIKGDIWTITWNMNTNSPGRKGHFSHGEQNVHEHRNIKGYNIS